MGEGTVGSERDSWFLVFPITETLPNLLRAPGTLAVIVSSLLVVGLGRLRTGITRALECTTAGIANGELWRLVTYVLPHEGGWPHVLINMVLLALYGWQLERRVGPARFLIVYFGSGALGMALLLGRHPIDAELGLRSGASLAVFGTVAALATWHATRGGRRNPATPWGVGTCVVLLVASGLLSVIKHDGETAPRLGWFMFGFANHTLGMIAGVILGVAVDTHISPVRRGIAAALAVLAATSAIAVGVTRWA